MRAKKNQMIGLAREWKSFGSKKMVKERDKEKSNNLVKAYHISFWIQSTWDRKGSMSMSVYFSHREIEKYRQRQKEKDVVCK